MEPETKKIVTKEKRPPLKTSTSVATSVANFALSIILIGCSNSSPLAPVNAAVAPQQTQVLAPRKERSSCKTNSKTLLVTEHGTKSDPSTHSSETVTLRTVTPSADGKSEVSESTTEFKMVSGYKTVDGVRVPTTRSGTRVSTSKSEKTKQVDGTTKLVTEYKTKETATPGTTLFGPDGETPTREYGHKVVSISKEFGSVSEGVSYQIDDGLVAIDRTISTTTLANGVVTEVIKLREPYIEKVGHFGTYYESEDTVCTTEVLKP